MTKTHPAILAAATSAVTQAEYHFPNPRTKKQRTDRADMALSVLLGFHNGMIYMGDPNGLGPFPVIVQLRDAYDECKRITQK